MFLSAIVKWVSDDNWRNMSALRYHFETQPIPTWTSWHAHWSPHLLLSIACFGMFVIEGIVPFLYFMPRRTRMLGFWMTVLLQVSIMATGNYGFFNVLAIVLAFSLLDDAAVARLYSLPLKWQRHLITPPVMIDRRPILRPIFVWPLALVVFIVGLMMAVIDVSRTRVDWPAPLARLAQYVGPFNSANAYGLFRVMTTERPELVIEGSNDGSTWKEYAFKWKAGDVNRAPAFCEPHMPRLDWQMWFAALAPEYVQPWVQNLVYRLLTGQPEVLKLMDANPFPDHPPRYIRIVLYDYHFSTPAERKATGARWTRKPLRLYLPPVSIQRAIDDRFKL
jgi:hypothetical protein